MNSSGSRGYPGWLSLWAEKWGGLRGRINCCGSERERAVANAVILPYPLPRATPAWSQPALDAAVSFGPEVLGCIGDLIGLACSRG